MPCLIPCILLLVIEQHSEVCKIHDFLIFVLSFLLRSHFFFVNLNFWSPFFVDITRWMYPEHEVWQFLKFWQETAVLCLFLLRSMASQAVHLSKHSERFRTKWSFFTSSKFFRWSSVLSLLSPTILVLLMISSGSCWSLLSTLEYPSHFVVGRLIAGRVQATVPAFSDPGLTAVSCYVR